jgi:hypothetical protein
MAMSADLNRCDGLSRPQGPARTAHRLLVGSSSTLTAGQPLGLSLGPSTDPSELAEGGVSEPWRSVSGVDTWITRDLPVLRAIVLGYDNIGSSPDVNKIAQTTGLEVEEVIRGVRALEYEDPPFLLNLQWGMSGTPWVTGTPTGHARRAIGVWPTAESLATLLVRGLEKAAKAEPDE